MSPVIVQRTLQQRLAEELQTFRAVTLGGARQSGKTTMVSTASNLTVVSLDDPAALEAALHDPIGFVEALGHGTAIDEFQRAGESLLLAVKHRLDRNAARGQFLLTGSANYLANRGISETLAGRTARLTLWPLSMGELSLSDASSPQPASAPFVDRLFDRDAWPPHASRHTGKGYDRGDLATIAVNGGYPEPVITGMTTRSRALWFDSYLDDVISREALRGVGDVRSADDLRRVLHLVSARSPGELVMTDLARDARLHRNTAAAYVDLLQALYLITRVPAWSTSATTRAKRHPKVLLNDSGLLAHLRGVDADGFLPGRRPRDAGDVFESFVLAELHKQVGWAERAIEMMHFRDRNGAEVDGIVVERRSGTVAGIEVKLTSTPRREHARHLALLRDRLGDQFTVGLVIHTGQRVLPLGERLWAVPAGMLAS